MSTEIVTADELAALLKVSRAHIFSLAAERAIPSLKLGRSVRFVLADVLEVIERKGAAA